MTLETKYEQRVWALIDKLADKDKSAIEQMFDLVLWGHYLPQVLANFGLGYAGCVFRQRAGSTVLTVKVVESGVPLVAFINSYTTIGGIEQMFDLLWSSRLKWQKDKFPWI